MKWLSYFLFFCLGAGLNGLAQKRPWSDSPCAPRSKTEEWVMATGRPKDHPVTRRTMNQVQKIKQTTVDQAKHSEPGLAVKLPGMETMTTNDKGQTPFDRWLEERKR